MAVYGFLSAYALACVALPVFLKKRNELSVGMMVLPAAAVIAILLALVERSIPCRRLRITGCHTSTWRRWLWDWLPAGSCKRKSKSKNLHGL